MARTSCITTANAPTELDTRRENCLSVAPLDGVRPPAAAGLAAVVDRACALDPLLARRRVAVLADRYAAAALERCVDLVGGAGRLTARDSVELEASDLWRAAVGALGLDWKAPVTVLVGVPFAHVLDLFDVTVALSASGTASAVSRPAHTFDATLRLNDDALGRAA